MLDYNIEINNTDDELNAQFVIGDKYFEMRAIDIQQTKPRDKDWKSKLSLEELNVIVKILEFNNI